MDKITKQMDRLKTNPKDISAFKGLEEEYKNTQEWDKLLDLYQLRADAIENTNKAEAASLYFKIAEIYEKQIGAVEDSLIAYKMAFRLHPQNKEYGDVIARYYLSKSDWTKALDILQRQQEFLEEVDLRVPVLLQIALLYRDHFQNKQEAKRYLSVILRMTPNMLEAFQVLESLYIEDHQWEELVTLYNNFLQASIDVNVQKRLLKECALICQEKLSDIPRTIEYYNRLLQLDSSNIEILNILESLYTQIEQWESVLKISEQELHFLNNTLKAQKYIQMAQICAEKLGNTEKAIHYYELSLQTEENDNILKILEQNYLNIQNWKALAEIYRKQANRTTNDDTIIELYCKIAKIYEQNLKDIPTAISWFERSWQKSQKKLSILQTLQRLYEMQQDYPHLIQSYTEELNFIDDLSLRIGLYYKIANIYIIQNDLQSVAKTYEAVLKECPTHKQTLEEIKTVYWTLQAYVSYLRILDMQIAPIARAAEAIPLYLKQAEVWTEQLKNEDKAIEVYWKVLELDKKQLKVWQILYNYYQKKNNYSQIINTLENIISLDYSCAENGYFEIASLYLHNLHDDKLAIEFFQKVLSVNSSHIQSIKALSSLYEKLQIWDLYISNMCHWLELSIDPEEQIDLHFSLAKIFVTLHNDEEETHLLEVLKIDFANKKAINALKKFYELHEQWDKYALILEREAQVLATMDEELAKMYIAIAVVYEDKLKNLERSILFYEKARYLLPNDLDILDMLERLYEVTKKYDCLVYILESKASLINDVILQKGLYFQIGHIFYDYLQNPSKAIYFFNKVIEIDKTHKAALKNLEKLYTQEQNFQKLSDIYIQEAENCMYVEDKIPYYLQAAKLWEESIVDLEHATKIYEEILVWDEKNLTALDRLIAIYFQLEKWESLAIIYTKKLACLQDSESLITLSFDLGSIYKDQLQAYQQAIRVYQDILALDFSDIYAVQALKDIYLILQNWDKLEETLKLECTLTEDIEQKKSLYLQMAQLAEEKMGKYELAITNYKNALSYQDDNRSALQSIRRLLYHLQNYEQIIPIIDKELTFVKAPGERVELFFEKGKICQEKLLNYEVAIEAYEKVLEIGPGNLNAYQALVTIHRQRNEHLALLNTWKRQIRISSPDKQKELWLESSKVWEQLNNDEEAKKCLLEALTIDSNYTIARQALESIYNRLSDWNSLIVSIDEAISVTQDQEQLVQLQYKKGQILEQHLSQIDQALQCYYTALQYNSTYLPAIRSLQEIFSTQSCYDKLLDAYQRELAIEDNEVERKIMLYLFCAELQWKKLNDLDGAIQSYSAILESKLDSNNLVAIRGLQELYACKEQYKEWQVMLFKELELQKDINRLFDIHLQLAYLLEEKLHNYDIAIEHFSEAHLSRPDNLPILRKLKALLRKCERWQEYADIVEKEISLCSGNAILIPLHEDLVQVYEEQLQNIDKAILHAEVILTLKNNDIAMLQKLQYLYKQNGSIEKLAESYLKEAKLPETAINEQRLITLYQESAKCYADSLSRLEEAAECYEKVIQIDPTNKESLVALVNIYNSLSKWENLIEIYELVAQLSKNATEIEMLYLKIGELWERELKNDTKALLNYQIVYTMNAQNYSAVNSMRKIFEREKRWGDAIEMLNAEAILIEDKDEKKVATLYLRMGEYWENNLGMPHQALTCYLKVLGHGFHRPTAERIMKIQEQVGDYPGLVEILERYLKILDKPEDAIPKYLYLAKIQWKRLQNYDIAIETYCKVLKLNPRNMESILALEELLAQQKKWKQLITILQNKRDLISDPKDLLSVCTKLADIYQHQVHNGNLAIRYYEQALELAPHDLELIHILQKLYYEWGYFKKLIGLYQKEILLIEDHETIIHLYEQIGSIWEYKLFEEEQAIHSYEKLLEINSSNFCAIKALSTLYEKYQSWDKLITIYHFLIEDATYNGKVDDEIYYLTKLGSVYQNEKHDANNAISVFNQVIALEPANHNALQALEELYKTLNKSSDMAELLRQKLLNCETDAERLELYTHLGNLYNKELNDTEKAIESFNNALTLNPKQLDVLQALDSLYLRSQNWTSLVHICMQEIEIQENLDEKAELCYRLGMLYLEHFQDTFNAKAMFLASVDYKPNMLKSLKQLVSLALLDENWSQAVKYIGMEIVHVKDPKDKVALLTELGSLYQNKLKLIQKAKETFQNALEIDPQSTIAIEAMADIYYMQKEPAQAEPLLGRLALLVPKTNREKLSEIYYKWGLVAEKLDKKDDAIVRYSNALEMCPNHLDSLCALGSLYFARAQWGFDKSQWQEALDIYQKVYQHPNLESKEDVVRRLAVMYEKLDQLDMAIEYYLKVLADVPDDLESIQALASLYCKKGNDEEALQYLQRVVRHDSASFQDRRSTLLTIAEVQTRLQNHREAIDARMKAMSMGVEDPIILKEIGDSYIALKEWDQACVWIEKHYLCLEELNEKVDNRCLIASIYQKKGDNQQAIKIYQQALEDNPAWVPAVIGLASIYESQGLWNEVASCYTTFLKKLPSDQKMVGLPIHFALGSLYHEKMHDNNAAIKQFTIALSLDKKHIASRAALAAIKSEDPALHKEAIQEHLILLQKEPYRASSYRGLYNLYRQEHENDLALRSLRMLSLQEKLLKEEEEFLSVNKPKQIIHPLNAYTFSSSDEQQKLYEIMACTGDSMSKVYAIDIEMQYGLRRKDRLMENNNPTLWRIINHLLHILSLPAVDIYIIPQKSHRILIENTQPVSIILSQILVDNLDQNELAFLFARCIFYIYQNQFLAYKLDNAALYQYFRLLKCASLEIQLPVASEEEQLLKKIKGALPRKIRKSFAENPDIFKFVTEQNVSAYSKKMEYAANRFALLYSDSLELSLQMIYKLSVLQSMGKLVKLDKIPWQEVSKMDACVDLVRYNLTTDYSNLRNQLGISI